MKNKQKYTIRSSGSVNMRQTHLVLGVMGVKKCFMRKFIADEGSGQKWVKALLLLTDGKK